MLLVIKKKKQFSLTQFADSIYICCWIDGNVISLILHHAVAQYSQITLVSYYCGCACNVVVSALRYHAKRPGFVPRPGRSLLRIIPSQVLPAHSAVMCRLGIHLIEGKAVRERWPPPLYAVAENQAITNATRPYGLSCPWDNLFTLLWKKSHSITVICMQCTCRLQAAVVFERMKICLGHHNQKILDVCHMAHS